MNTKETLLPLYLVTLHRLDRGSVVTQHFEATGVQIAEGAFVINNDNTGHSDIFPNNTQMISIHSKEK